MRGELRVPDAARWWPHTHGEPALHEVRLRVDVSGEEVRVRAGRVGFRELAFGARVDGEPDVESDGLAISVNGVEVFARGACGRPRTPSPWPPMRTRSETCSNWSATAGMNMLRIPGTAAYESAQFHDLCDELGIMLWQDFMFANFDYPVSDPDVPRDGAARGEMCARVGRRAPEPDRAVRQQRGRAAGRDAGP